MSPFAVSSSMLLYAILSASNGYTVSNVGPTSPSNNFMGIQVCYKREIAHTFIAFNIGDVTYPNLVRMGRNDSLNQVWVFAIIMVGICCLIAPTALYYAP